MNRSERVDGIANLGELGEHFARVLAAKQGAVVPPANAFRKDVEIGVDPDRCRMIEDERARAFVHERAAACRNDLRPTVDQSGDHAPFPVTKMCLAEALEDFRDGQACCLFDLMICVDERNAEPLRKTAADRCLADTHQADENDGASNSPLGQFRFTVHRAGGYTQP